MVDRVQHSLRPDITVPKSSLSTKKNPEGEKSVRYCSVLPWPLTEDAFWRPGSCCRPVLSHARTWCPDVLSHQQRSRFPEVRVSNRATTKATTWPPTLRAGHWRLPRTNVSPSNGVLWICGEKIKKSLMNNFNKGSLERLQITQSIVRGGMSVKRLVRCMEPLVLEQADFGF